jgi:hypothetical protein
MFWLSDSSAITVLHLNNLHGDTFSVKNPLFLTSHQGSGGVALRAGLAGKIGVLWAVELPRV